MRSVNITFQHGHIYNSDTGERLGLEEGRNYSLIYSNEADLRAKKFERQKMLRSEDQIKEEILKSEKVTHIKKLKSENSNLYFFVSETNENEEGTSIKRSWFRITLLEPLFLYSSSEWKSKDLIIGGKLADCACMVDKSEDEPLPFFEVIYVKSVNAACKMTHVHYFGNSGSPSKNVFNRVYLSKSKSKENSLETLRRFGNEHLRRNLISYVTKSK